MTFDGKAFGEQIVLTVREFMARSMDALSGRIDAVESAWKRFNETHEQELERKMTEAIARIPSAPPVEVDYALIERGIAEGIAKAVADPEMVRPVVADEVAKAVGALPPAKDGQPGKDAPPIDRADLAAMVAAAVSEIPRPRDGEPGKSVTQNDVLALLAPLVNQWALDFERRAQDVFAAAIQRMPKAKDGADGFSLDDFDMSLGEDGRTLSFKFVRGDIVRERQVKLAVLLDTGIYRVGGAYSKGDGATWDGSFWIAQRETQDKPGTSDAWRLAVKRGQNGKDGRDGKDGAPGIQGKEGTPGRDGRTYG